MTNAHTKDLILVPLGIGGALDAPLARVRSIDAGPKAAGEPVFARATIEEADIDTLEAALLGGVAGVVLCGAARVAELEQLASRLAAAEAVTGMDDGSTAILVLVDNPVSAAAVGALGRPTARLTGIGIDTGLLADHFRISRVEPHGAVVTVARGATVLAAAAAGVPAFEVIPGPLTTQALEASRADGFAWAMVPDRHLVSV